MLTYASVFTGSPEAAVVVPLWAGVLLITMIGLAAPYRRVRARAMAAGWAEGVAEGRRIEHRAHLRTMHDTVLQTLEAIVTRADADAAADPEAALADVRRYARRQALELRHQLTSAASPQRDPGRRSVVALLERLSEEATAKGLAVELNCLGLEGLGMDADPADAVLGAVREGLSNVVKHAGTTRAVVLAQRQDDRVVITIRDHGRGFDPAAMPVGFGLRGSIIDRVSEAGGSVEIDSTPGAGTRVRLTVPLRGARGAVASGLRRGLAVRPAGRR